ncbi:MAG: non-homologous end-joining DNA ligase [Thermaerobacterales bacterium]
MTDGTSRARLTVAIDGRQLSLTNRNKPLWPEGLTKADLISYLVDISPWLLPHLEERFLVFTRYPDGINGKSFYQKNLPDRAPDWVACEAVWSEDTGRWIRYARGADRATLAWLGNLAVIEIHPWTSRSGSADQPDYALIDLDPSAGTAFEDAVTVALKLGDILDHLGLRGYVKTSGATGLHIYIPIEPHYSYADTAGLVRRLGLLLKHALPNLVTLERAVRKRRGHVYVDYLQNGRGKTLVGPYVPRPRPGAPVSFPVLWSDLRHIHPDDFTLQTVPGLLRRGGDRFAAVLAEAQDLRPALQALERIGYE